MSVTPADVARIRAITVRLTAQDVRVVWVDGWDARHNGSTFGARGPAGLWLHWDASTVLSGEWGALGIVTNGRGGASPVPGPLSQFMGARCLDGVPKVAVVAAGPANHAGKGGPLTLPDGTVIPQDAANSRTFGTEWAWAGPGELLRPASLHAYQALGYACREVLS